MSPAPARVHQDISMRFSVLLHDFFKDRGCSVYAAPFDVRFPDSDNAEDEAIDTVVQPDISVICDPEKLDNRGCVGAPDLIIEILSPSTAGKDLKDKRALYEQHGVKEYWLAHPTDQVVMTYRLGEDDQYSKATVYARKDQLKSTFFDGLAITLTDIFEERSNEPVSTTVREIYL